MMVRSKWAFLNCIVLVGFVLGCGGPGSEQALIKKANKDDKSFRGTWVYKSKMGEQIEFPIRARVDIVVSGKKFRLAARWTGASLSKGRRTEEWKYDGKVLWHLIPFQKQVNRLDIKGFKRGPFWKMPPRVTPFAPPRPAGEGEVAGRRCKILRTSGRYDQGYVTLTYWIDEEKKVLLKKEHLLEAAGLLLVNEVFECENIQFDPSISKEVFEPNVPSDWVEVKKLYLDCELLETKF